jgi:hypothetical protein
MRERGVSTTSRGRFARLSAALMLSMVGCTLLAPTDDELLGGDLWESGGETNGGGGTPSSGQGGQLTRAGMGGWLGAGESSSAGSGGILGAGGEPVSAGAAGEVDSGGAGGVGGNAGAPSSGSGGAPPVCPTPMPACMPGAEQTREAACGNCGKVTQKQICQADCTWGPWTDTSTCGGQGECAPNAKSTSMDRCPGACGPRTLTRTCTAACTWGPATVTSSTCVACAQCGLVEYCDAPGERGTWCRQTHAACSDAEINAECAAILADIGCVRHEPYYLERL